MTFGDGAERQSRSWRWTTLPCPSPIILYFNVFGPTNIALEEDGVVAESATGFALGFVEG